MKKLTYIKAGNAVKIFVLTFILSLTACNSNNNGSQPVENNPQGEDSMAIETKEPDSTASVASVENDTIVSIADSTVSEQIEPEAEVKEQPKQKTASKKADKKESVSKQKNSDSDKSAPAPQKNREEDEGVLVW